MNRDKTVTHVNHDSLLTHGSKCLGRAHGAPIELDRASDTVNTASENDGTLVLKGNVVGRGVVGGVEIVGVGRELSGKGVNPLDPRPDAKLQSGSADLVLGAADGDGDLLVREAQLLGLGDMLLLDALEASNLLELSGAVDNVLKLVKEPLVDLCQVVDLVNRVVLVKHGLANSQPTAVSRVLKLKVQVLEFRALEANKVGVDLSDGLLERLFKGTADGHDLSDRLHGTANITLDVLELGQIPTGDLGDDVIERRLEVGGGGLGDGIRELGQGVAKSDLGSRVSQGVAGSLGGQGRRTRKTGVDFNDPVVQTVWLKGVLHVALANDTQVADNLDSSSTKHMVLLVAQGLTGGNDDRVSGVDAQWVEVLHVADSDAVVVGIANHLVLDLLPALERLLNQDLGGECERPGRHVAQLLLVVGETRTKTSERKGSADDDGITNLLGGIESLVDGVDSNRLGDGDVDLLEGLCEHVSVLAELQCPHAGAENPDAVLLEKSQLLHLDTEVEGGLASEREEDAIGLLALDDVLDILDGDGEVVDLVGKAVVGLDGRNVGVDEDRGDASLFEGLEGLRSYSRVVVVSCASWFVLDLVVV